MNIGILENPSAIEHNNILIREVQEEDAKGLVKLFLLLDQETDFMMLEPGERQTNLDDQKKIIRQFLSNKNQAMIVVECKGEHIGFIVATAGVCRRNQHNSSLVLGVAKEWWGQGIGTRLLDNIEQWAANNHIHRLELTVMKDNSRALALYKKIGFIVEGEKRDSLRVNGVYVEEYYMSKLLDNEEE
jgi:RimJ/RimL family protein N-acetyltransferase